jgi:hypothetical protein
MTFIAEATSQPIDWTARITLWTGIALAGITALALVSKFAIGKYKEIRDELRGLRASSNTNAQNVATVAKVSDGLIQAQRMSPGPNVPISAVAAVRQIASDPTQVAEAPRDVSPVGAPTATPEGTQRAFDAAEKEGS